MKRRIATASLALLAVLHITAATCAASPEALVAQYIKLSGIDDMLASFQGHIDTLAAQQLLTSKDPGKDRKIAAVLKGSFNPAAAEKNLTEFLLKSTDSDFLQSLIQWYASPVARKITEEEKKSARPEAQADMMRYITELPSNPPPQERIAFIHELEETTKQSELAIDILLFMTTGVFDSFNASLPEEAREAKDRFEEELLNARPAMQESLRREIILESFYTYRAVSDEELKTYIQFYASPLGQKELDITGKGIAYVLRLWFSDVAKELVKMVEEERRKEQGQDKPPKADTI